MSCECDKNVFVLLKGYASRWDGVDWLSISFSSETQVDFTGFSAKFKIGQYVFENNDLTQPWIINLTDEQTATLPLGMNTGSLIVYDTEGAGKPFTTTIPILVKDWVDGDVEIDTYNATILATLDNQNEFIVNVETAKVSLEYLDEKIEEHNESEDAHQYIQGLISSEEERAKEAEQEIRDSIPEVNDGVLTIIQNGESVGTFSANQKENTEIVIKAGDSIVNIDGGSASSVYLFEQIIDGGNAEGE